ncbi:nuclear transport factor 2 family protein [Vibrio salinus]|uniref:nuclear transport factor 2 family protein n=1 Tax=Vibrio salinus TaxID=2899784 RepID=UPI001E5C41E3|nr:nuclear transport factor 2 family protein [Vibrio salinus]MCE0495484.1 nuclear transport factor 2 family protein [Vibrio salinus]
MEQSSTTHWRQAIERKDISMLEDILAEDVEMYPPNINEAYRGKEAVLTYLSGAFKIFFNQSFRYTSVLDDSNHAVLEFCLVTFGENIEGAEIIRWNQNHKIKQIKLLLRPLNSVSKVHQSVAAKHKAQMKSAKAGK